MFYASGNQQIAGLVNSSLQVHYEQYSALKWADLRRRQQLRKKNDRRKKQQQANKKRIDFQ